MILNAPYSKRTRTSHDTSCGRACKAKKNGTVLYCGEYGVIDLAEPEDALKWFKAINTAFDRLGISRAAWSYKKMDFGISDSRMDNIRSEIIKYL